VLQDLEQERPSDRVESPSNVHLNQKGWPLPSVKEFSGALDHLEVILDEPPFHK
jgi:hypothetical protein